MSDVRALGSVPVTAQFVGIRTPTACAPLVVDNTTGHIYAWKTGDVIVAAGAEGTVTSVAQSFTGGLISVSGSPITTTGTLALTVAGTSGGIPYFSGAATWASSALLAANQIILGGGAATAPTTLGSLGTTTTVLHGNAAGAPTFGAVSLTADVSGTLPVANGGTGSTTLTFPSGTATLPQVKSGSFTPSWTSLTVVGTPTYTGTYTRIDDRVFCSLQVDSTVSTAATAGTTFFTGLPYTPTAYAPVVGTDLNTPAGTTNGWVQVSNARCYPGGWAAVANVCLQINYRTTDAF